MGDERDDEISIALDGRPPRAGSKLLLIAAAAGAVVLIGGIIAAILLLGRPSPEHPPEAAEAPAPQAVAREAPVESADENMLAAAAAAREAAEGPLPSEPATTNSAAPSAAPAH